MKRFTKKLLAALFLAVGITLFGWGWHAFAKVTPSETPDEDYGLMCPPTIGEIIGIGPLGHKLGYFSIAVIGLAAAGFSLLSLIQSREHARSAD